MRIAVIDMAIASIIDGFVAAVFTAASRRDRSIYSTAIDALRAVTTQIDEKTEDERLVIGDAADTGPCGHQRARLARYSARLIEQLRAASRCSRHQLSSVVRSQCRILPSAS